MLLKRNYWKDSPCRTCDQDSPGRRHPGCHGHCEIEAAFREYIEAEEAKQEKAIEEHFLFKRYQGEAIRRSGHDKGENIKGKP